MQRRRRISPNHLLRRVNQPTLVAWMNRRVFSTPEDGAVTAPLSFFEEEAANGGENDSYAGSEAAAGGVAGVYSDDKDDVVWLRGGGWARDGVDGDGCGEGD